MPSRKPSPVLASPASKSSTGRGDSPPNQQWSIKQVADYLGLSVKTIRRWVEAGEFPKPRKLNGFSVRWSSREVEKWCESQPVAD